MKPRPKNAGQGFPPPPAGPGIWRKENNGWVKTASDPDTPRSTPNQAPATKGGTVAAIQGQPRKDLPVGGAHLIFYPMLKSWVGRNPAAGKLWAALGIKRRDWFLCLASVALLPAASELVPPALKFCNELAPELTPKALLLLKRRAKKIKAEDYRSACSNVGYGTDKVPRKLSFREADRRRKARKALADFESDTAPRT
jgi:hypothetical protein